MTTNERPARRPVRESVDWFAQQMEAQLAKPENEAKGGWAMDSLSVLLGRLHEEVAELDDALHIVPGQKADAATVIAEAADIANFAMMISDKVRSVQSTK